MKTFWLKVLRSLQKVVGLDEDFLAEGSKKLTKG
jgi:hypothetical protein